MSWSGGKDACFAYYEVMRGGDTVSHLMNYLSSHKDRDTHTRFASVLDLKTVELAFGINILLLASDL